LAEFHFYKGLLYEEQKQYDQALNVIKQALELDRGNPEMLFRQGIILDKMDKKAEALAIMRQILAMEPNNVNALNYIGYSYAENGILLHEAKQLIEKALKLKPNDGYITDSLAWVYFKMHQYHKALDLILKAIELVPNDPVILEHLGDVYHGLGNRDSAREAYRKALEYKHEQPDKIQQKIRNLD